MACDCMIPENANEAKDKAVAVFSGEVLQIKKERTNGESYQVALISVSEIWKGIEETQVLVYTDWASSCQFDFEVGEKYLLYPYENDGKLKVIDCGRSAEIRNASQDLLELGKGEKPNNTVQLDKEMRDSKLLFVSILLVLFISAIVFVYSRKRKN